jgi:ankyrin repeat protein
MTALIVEGARGDVADKRCNSTVESAPTEPVLGNDPSGAALEDANALGIAVQNHDISMVSNLLQGGSDPNQTIKEWRNNIAVLYYAAKHGQREIVSLLLSHGAETEVTDSHGWRPLHVACFKGHTDIARALISKGADVHASTVTWNNSQEKNSGLSEDEAWTGTSRHAATMGGHSDIVKILLEHNVDVHASTGVTANHLASPASGPTALHIALSVNPFCLVACKLPSPERLQIAQWLVDAGVMVQGVIQRFSLKDILCFEKFPELWDSLVAGDA